ncbi:MAG: biosynthetic-type acetolactate synthase large subunit [Proteobacteria bacterium]|nr:biosynthetic-type acetolactate synthase large subunit [Pseudomonadota bacterium]
MKMTGSQAIMQSLVNEGVDTIFGYPGGAIMPAYDALYDYRDKLRHILVRHEQGASHAAEGYARVAGKAGVCLATSGPGATNLVTGIADAMMDSVPLVCITGQVHKDLLGTDAFQEADVIGITIPITKWNYQITDAEEIPSIIAKAFFIAENGRPGPVLIDITKNAQIQEIEYSYKKMTAHHSIQMGKEAKEKDLQAAADLINNSQKPFILVGHGVLISKAQKDVIALAEKADIPIASTLHGLSAVSTQHKLYTGMLGMHGNYGPNVLTNEADLIIAVGMRFDDRVTGNLKKYAVDAKIIHIDIDAAEINKIKRADVSLVADAKSALTKLTPLVNKATHTSWLAEFERYKAIEHEKIIEKAIHPLVGELKMSEVVNSLSEATNGEAIIVADVGQHQMMAARYYKFKKPDSYITSGGLGTMGFALPACIGAKFAAPERDVIAIIGDGCFQMTIQELATIAQEELEVKIVIFNNNFLGMVRQWQELFFEKRYSFVDLKNPDFVKISEGFGINSSKATTREELAAGISKMLKTKGPYVLEVLCEKEQNVFPMVPTGAAVSDIRLE